MAMQAKQTDKIRLSGLWKNEADSGLVYYSGSLGTARLLLFENESPGDRGPELVLYLAPAKKKEDGDGRDRKSSGPFD